MRIYYNEVTDRAVFLVVAWVAVLVINVVFTIWPEFLIDESRLRFNDLWSWRAVRPVPAFIALLVYGAALVATARFVLGLANAIDNAVRYLMQMDAYRLELKERDRARASATPSAAATIKPATPMRWTE